jgi:hypothetical protein
MNQEMVTVTQFEAISWLLFGETAGNHKKTSISMMPNQHMNGSRNSQV